MNNRNEARNSIAKLLTRKQIDKMKQLLLRMKIVKEYVKEFGYTVVNELERILIKDQMHQLRLQLSL